MSAIIVLVLRIILILFLYGFLVFAFLTLWRELKITSENERGLNSPKITIGLKGESPKQFVQTEILVGRGMENDIQFINETVSLTHARLFFHNNFWMLEDSHSTNGTFLNGELIHSATILVDEDQIGIGDEVIKIVLGNK